MPVIANVARVSVKESDPEEESKSARDRSPGEAICWNLVISARKLPAAWLSLVARLIVTAVVHIHTPSRFEVVLARISLTPNEILPDPTKSPVPDPSRRIPWNFGGLLDRSEWLPEVATVARVGVLERSL